MERYRKLQGLIVKRITGCFKNSRSSLRLNTQAWRIRSYMNTKVGKPFDLQTFVHDLRRIRNLEMHRPLNVRVDEYQGGVEIHFWGEDKWSTIPYGNFFAGGEIWQIIGGIYDVNPFGTIFTIGVELTILGTFGQKPKPGGLVYWTVPRIFGLPLRWQGSVGGGASLITLYHDRGYPWVLYEQKQAGGWHGLSWEFFQWLRVGFRESISRRRYQVRGLYPLAEGERQRYPRAPRGGLTHEIGLWLRFGHLAYRDYLYHGLTLRMGVDFSSRTLGSDADYVQMSATALGFVNLGRYGGNLAVRLSAGHMTEGGRYAHLFKLGPWSGLRGFNNNQFVGRTYLYGNIEYRSGLLKLHFPVARIVPYFRGRVLRLQAVVFADAAAVAGGGIYRLRESGHPLVAVGAGFRAMVTNVYKAVLRVDFAYTVSPYRSYDLIIATQQTF